MPNSYLPADLDTLRDGKMLWHLHAGRHFAATLLYKLADKTISVTLPQTTTAVDIAVATRLYDRMVGGDENFAHNVIIVHHDGDQWVSDVAINTHSQPRFETLEVTR